MDLSYIKLIDIVLLIFGFTVHEVFHAITADKFGDSTAKDAGRITLNPIPHIDPIASILLPLLVGIGAAKPVPVDFNRLRPKRLGMAMVSLAGPLSNFGLAVVFALILKTGLTCNFSTLVLTRGIFLNILLGIFNLIPIPPLDGSKVLIAFVPESIREKVLSFENYGFIVLLLLVFLGGIDYIVEPVFSVFVKLFALIL